VKKLRVIQWTTGKVGKLSLRAILDDPRLELAGVYAYSKDKAGVDAGKLCGRPDCGVSLPAVNAVFDIKAARSGVLGLRDVGLPYAPAGIWLGNRSGASK
jgi:hypothetical protein